ncbi:hypothetical protein EGW08_016538 [Elysia chlorotica]|uniref:Uncharacterized protein n=1 Tax=Elysia chlorotica TaxID=188477 RepID=A0A433T2C0_ELYCH|nr:hypothetical protein EGW08_016538 [Elysia chlorotica]
MVLRGARTHSRSKKKPAVSDTSMRLFIKCLNNLMTSQNGSSSPSSKRLLRQKIICNNPKSKRHKEDNPNILSEPQSYNIEERPSLSRSSSGLSAMQTLLEAAAIAGKNSSLDDYDAETAAYNKSPKPANDPVLPQSSETKQHRKSPRIASRLKKKELAKANPPSVSPVTPVAWAPQPEKLTEPGHLTNLDLLSSVSLDMEKRNPVMPSSSISSSVAQPVIFSNSLLKMPPHNTVINPNFGGPPPLLFAQPGKDGKLPIWVTQSNSIQPLLPQSVSGFSGVIVTETEATNHKIISPDCGAMDLTKPKSLEGIPHGLVSMLCQRNIAGGEPPQKFQKVLASGGSDNIPVEILMNDGVQGQTQPQSLLPRLPAVVTMNKLSDASLQNRMYASARDYKLEKKSPSPSGRQIQAMVSNRGGAAKGGSDEIQCGYKWSGSGGQVKERTQMVRELVPQDVMATYLNKQLVQLPGPRPAVPVPQEVPPHPVGPKSQKPLPRLVVGATRAFLPQHLKSLPKFPSPASPGEEVSCQVALNLTTGRPKTKEASPRGKAATRSKRQSKKGNQAAQDPVVACISDTESVSPIAVTTSTSSAGQSYQLQGSGVTLSCTFSSPSLAAILQNKKEPSSSVAAILQSTKTSSNSVSVTASIKESSVNTHVLNNDSGTHFNSSVAHTRKGSQTVAKFEPPNMSLSDNDECVIMSLPVKVEPCESQNRDQRAEREGSASPGNLVVDLQTDSSSPAVTSNDHVAVKQERPFF